MNDNELLEALVIAILTGEGLDHGTAQGAHSIVRHARQLLNETRKAQEQIDAEKFAASAPRNVYDN